MINFLHSLYNGILRARREHKLLFVLLLLLELCFAPLHTFTGKNPIRLGKDETLGAS
jgi:hypothetical protein